ncbi:MAG TPA: rhomboid family intramembrane serine protease [Candidatus Angelobacter sp.]|nr:rhomboid family intramembrane serine protease [Candidatus Angelobacter sp.]
MRRAPMSLSFPPFTGAIKILVAINTAVFLLTLLLGITGHGSAVDGVLETFALNPHHVAHGHIWELFTYAFIHLRFFHLLFNMLMLWMFGSMLQSHWGSRQFWEFYLFGVFGAGLSSVAVAFTLEKVLHQANVTPYTYGASGGIYAILMAAAMLFGDQEVFLFPLPFAMRLKYLVGLLALIALVGALGSMGGLASLAQLGGLLFGFIYVKFVPRRGLAFASSESYYGIRNAYHRWKRERAKKKFQVYMRKHNQDPKQYFDEYGNFRPPDEKDKKGGPGGWVN